MKVQQANQYTHYGGEGPKRRENKRENLFENIMAKNFPNLRIYMDIHLKEAQQTSSSINPKTATLYIIFKLLNIEKQREHVKNCKRKITYKESSITLPYKPEDK